jgi:hypothetical protein
MSYIYLYSGGLAVKTPVKAVGIIWMTAIEKFGLPENFPYFFEALNK